MSYADDDEPDIWKGGYEIIELPIPADHEPQYVIRNAHERTTWLYKSMNSAKTWAHACEAGEARQGLACRGLVSKEDQRLVGVLRITNR